MPITVGTITPLVNGSASVTVAAGTDALVVTAGTHQGVITGVTFGATAFSSPALASGRSAFNECGDVWILLAPTPGTATVTVSMSGGSWKGGHAIALSGVKQTTTVVKSETFGNSSSASTSITPGSNNNLIIGAVGSEANVTIGATFTSIGVLQGQSYENYGGEYFQQGTAGAKTTNFPLGFGARWGLAVVAIEPAPATPISVADSGAGVDTVSPKARLTISETGSGTESVSDKVRATVSDSGTGADTLSAKIRVAVTDLFTAVETLLVKTGNRFINKLYTKRDLYRP